MQLLRWTQVGIFTHCVTLDRLEPGRHSYQGEHGRKTVDRDAATKGRRQKKVVLLGGAHHKVAYFTHHSSYLLKNSVATKKQKLSNNNSFNSYTSLIIYQFT